MAAQSVWDSAKGRSVARQVILGPADPPLKADLGDTRTVGTRAVGDVGALLWVAEQLDVIGHINRACGDHGAKNGPSVGEMVTAAVCQKAERSLRFLLPSTAVLALARICSDHRRLVVVAWVVVLVGVVAGWQAGGSRYANDFSLGNTGSQRAHEACGYAVVDRCVHYRKKL